MYKPPKIQAMEERENYRNTWKVELKEACCADPGCCCLSAICPVCVSYALRKRALHDDMSQYLCCNGYLPCSGYCGEQSCPEVCLACEVCCCFATSVAVTRFMIQDELQVQNTQCDNCLIATMIFFQQLACICHLLACITGSGEIGDIADCIQCIADLLYCSVCACMQTQHKVELDDRDENPSRINPIMPPQQQVMTAGPPVGYPTQPQYAGQPQYGAPPPQYQYHQSPPQYGAPPPQYGAPPPQYGAPPPGYPGAY
eukprot:TRINITY_DN2890_c0_g1_i1.p1 TRINITY_DN2890_c0_g1~~TRINITY_DN2890_c0_g1_i1.p1  ORF type:complete len:257 (-),score=13.81 TRINITY_DN2890_c0_g1_i1:502-1272(-)